MRRAAPQDIRPPAAVAGARPGALGALAGLVGLALGAPALALWLVVVSAGLVQPALADGLSLMSRLDVLGIERLVAVPVLLAGAVAAARLTIHTLLALGYVLAARAGRPLPRLRRVVAERAPAMVRGLARRAVGAGVGVSLGAGVALVGVAAVGAPAATAAPAAAAADDHASTGADTGSAADRPRAARAAAGLDLGWHDLTGSSDDLTTSSDDGARPAAALPPARTGTSTRAGSLDLGWQPVAAAGGTTRHADTPRTVDVPRAASASGAASATRRTSAPPGGATTEVTVRHGDTLWDIAAAHLGPEASDAEIARAWPRWYDANRDAIGADPDLLHPGTVLVSPEPA